MIIKASYFIVRCDYSDLIRERLREGRFGA